MTLCDIMVTEDVKQLSFSPDNPPSLPYCTAHDGWNVFRPFNKPFCGRLPRGVQMEKAVLEGVRGWNLVTFA